MEIGLVLPTIGSGAGLESVETGAETAQRLGWTSVWVTDHLVVGHGPEEEEYGTVLEAIVALTHVAARYPSLTVGTSVIIPPLRNSVILAKQLATLDVLSQGRLIVGVGVADSGDLTEFRNVGAEDRFQRRGDLVNETIALWRHLWSGRKEPFHGRFHDLEDYVFRPLPPQRGSLPIWTGGRSGRALRRAAALADGYHAAQTGPGDIEERLPKLRALVTESGRPFPTISVRARVRLGLGPREVYSICGSRKEAIDDVRAFADSGVDHLIVALGETAPSRIAEVADDLQEGVLDPALS